MTAIPRFGTRYVIQTPNPNHLEQQLGAYRISGVIESECVSGGRPVPDIFEQTSQGVPVTIRYCFPNHLYISTGLGTVLDFSTRLIGISSNEEELTRAEFNVETLLDPARRLQRKSLT